MGLNFPASPALNEKFPATPQAGIPTYTWDGEKWTTSGASIGQYVAKAGDTMTGPLVLSGDPTANLGAATKQYAVAKAGDTMSGPLVLPADPTVNLQASTKQYVDGKIALAVRYDTAQSLTAAQQQQARQNIYAAPFDAMAYSGLQINGSMEVSQEFAGAPTGVNNSYICDGWMQFWSGTMALNGTGGPLSNFVPGFGGLLFMQVATPQVTMNAADYAVIVQRVEGWRTARLRWGTANAQPITIGFWTSHTRPGLYTGTIRNLAASRSYAFTYTQAAASTAQYNIITIPGCVDGVWPVDNTTGMIITFTLACGTTNTAPSANSWLSGAGYFAGPGQINAVAATSDVFRITGVIVLPGTQAPTAAQSPLIMRPYDEELQLCKRYYQSYPMILVNPANNTSTIIFPTQMRASPVVGGGGPGFSTGVGSASSAAITVFQNTQGYQALTFDARL